jgi:transcriptional regulator with XRE-family HTH domain
MQSSSPQLSTLGPTVGRRVRLLRVAASLSQTALAESAGLSRTTLSRIELDQHQPHRTTLAALARALAVDLSVLADSRSALMEGRGS